jgi:hypothetical protein
MSFGFHQLSAIAAFVGGVGTIAKTTIFTGGDQ